MVGGSDVDVEPEVNVACSQTPSDPPVRERDVLDYDRDMSSWDAERLEPFDDLPVQGSLGICRASSESVDLHQRAAVRTGNPVGAGEAVRLVSEQPNMAVAWRDPECVFQR
jgi:hypothetical protein